MSSPGVSSAKEMERNEDTSNGVQFAIEVKKEPADFDDDYPEVGTNLNGISEFDTPPESSFPKVASIKTRSSKSPTKWKTAGKVCRKSNRNRRHSMPTTVLVRRTFGCPKCYETFRNCTLLREHFGAVHTLPSGVTNLIECEGCHSFFNGVYEYGRHSYRCEALDQLLADKARIAKKKKKLKPKSKVKGKFTTSQAVAEQEPKLIKPPRSRKQKLAADKDEEILVKTVKAIAQKIKESKDEPTVALLDSKAALHCLYCKSNFLTQKAFAGEYRFTIKCHSCQRSFVGVRGIQCTQVEKSTRDCKPDVEPPEPEKKPRSRKQRLDVLDDEELVIRTAKKVQLE